MNKQNGFTIIEVVIVIIIFSILAALFVEKIGEGKHKATAEPAVINTR